MFRTILAAAAALTMITGALAQSGTSALDNADMMKPFYTDDARTTMKSKEEVSAAVKAMNTEDRAKIAEECKDAKSPHDTFCEAFNEANKM